MAGINPLQKEVTEKILQGIREIRKEDRFNGPMAVYFVSIPKEKILRYEKEHPQLANRLFFLARRLAEGMYSAQMEEEVIGCFEHLFSRRKLYSLLIVDTHLFPEEEAFPEIFEPFQLKGLKLKDADRLILFPNKQFGGRIEIFKAEINRYIDEMLLDRAHDWMIIHLFHDYLFNLVYPSHIAVDLLLEKEDAQESIKTAFALKNVTERWKSFVKILENLLNKKETHEALEMVRSMKKEKSKSLTQLIDKMLKPSHFDIDQLVSSQDVDDAIQEAQLIQDVDEREKVLQRIVSGLARGNQVDKALEVCALIEDFDVHAYALSSVVNILSSKQEFSRAIEIMKTISDAGFKEDSVGYIVKGLLDSKQSEDAIEFAETLDDASEKTKAARIILSSKLANHDMEGAERVRERFSLVK